MSGLEVRKRFLPPGWREQSRCPESTSRRLRRQARWCPAQRGCPGPWGWRQSSRRKGARGLPLPTARGGPRSGPGRGTHAALPRAASPTPPPRVHFPGLLEACGYFLPNDRDLTAHTRLGLRPRLTVTNTDVNCWMATSSVCPSIHSSSRLAAIRPQA